MTSMRITAVTPEARDFVFDRLWQRGREELEILGISEDEARGIIHHEVVSGAPTMALWIGEAPVVILGLMRTDDPYGMRTWFQATDLFTRYARQITQQLRGSLTQFAHARHLDYIEVVSPCVHPDSGRWFAALGFELDVNRYLRAPMLVDGVERRLYRFERKFPREGERVLL